VERNRAERNTQHGQESDMGTYICLETIVTLASSRISTASFGKWLVKCVFSEACSVLYAREVRWTERRCLFGELRNGESATEDRAAGPAAVRCSSGQGGRRAFDRFGGTRINDGITKKTATGGQR
jgi:hypothetical protein